MILLRFMSEKGTPVPRSGRGIMSPGFWAMMILCLLCVAGGAALVLVGPSLIGTKKPGAPARTFGALSTPKAAPAPAPAPNDIATRLQSLEQQQAGAVNAAVSVLAADALFQAAERGRPFTAELAAFERIAPSPDAAALKPLAAVGAPTRAALAAQLVALAPEAALAARAPADDAPALDQAGYWASRLILIRRIDGRGSDSDARIARAERAALAGDLETAAGALDGLPQAARDRLAPWLLPALRRIEIDRRIAAIRTRAAAEVSGPAVPAVPPIATPPAASPPASAPPGASNAPPAAPTAADASKI